MRIESRLYPVTIAGSALLLFLVQPMIAKALLPRFGGSAGVWVTCMLFFQVALLAGYGYSYAITRHLSRRAQGLVHAALLMTSLAVLPLAPRMQAAAGQPVAAILSALAVSVGLPYFLLSTTSPLLQSWYAGAGAGRFPYWLFALSNAASLAALLAYPVAIEPTAPVGRQLWWWSAGYLAMVILAGVLALQWHGPAGVGSRVETSKHERPWMWIALAACASVLWLAVANHLSQEVAAVPFLWVLPLSLYLLSFIICFDARGWYRPAVFRWLLPLAWAAMSWQVARPGGLASEVLVFSLTLLACCVFCHGELARTKPDPKQGLAFFYLMVALGGAMGAVFVGLVAPNVFNSYLELPIGIMVCILLGLARVYGYPLKRLMRMAAVAAIAFVLATRYRASEGQVVQLRSFYGALRVSDAGAGERATRSLFNGRTLHGVEFLLPGRARIATTYYGPESGAGWVLSRPGGARRVGIVGLGVGTLALYGRRGDEFRFYEINPAVVEVAWQYFHFLSGAEAKIDVVTDDGRLALEREPLRSFDAIVLDAFSDDSIPVHLLTREAFQLYFQRLRPGGVLTIHLTNRYLDLEPIVAAAAAGLGKHARLVHNAPDPGRAIAAADWAIIDDSPETQPRRFAKAWTDEYSNLFQAWK